MTAGGSKRDQIVADIRQKIADHVEGYTPGSTLPTVAQFAAAYGVSTTTMDVAVKLLKHEGTIIGPQGGRLRVPIAEPNGDDAPPDAA